MSAEARTPAQILGQDLHGDARPRVQKVVALSTALVVLQVAISVYGQLDPLVFGQLDPLGLFIVGVLFFFGYRGAKDPNPQYLLHYVWFSRYFVCIYGFLFIWTFSRLLMFVRAVHDLDVSVAIWSFLRFTMFAMFESFFPFPTFCLHSLHALLLFLSQKYGDQLRKHLIDGKSQASDQPPFADQPPIAVELSRTYLAMHS